MNPNVAALQPEGAYEVLARANQLEAEGREVIHLEIGQPDYPTFSNITLAGIKALAEGKTDYNPSSGIEELREAVADRLTTTRENLEVTSDEVMVGPGAKPLLFLSTVALIEAGDHVLYPDPGFPTYRSMIEVTGGEPVPYGFREEDGFVLDTEELEARIGPETKLLLLNTPGNPLGNVISGEKLERIAELAKEYDTFVLSDEIYSEMIYEGNHRSIASYPGMKERTILVDGFSKTYSMTGWRLGFAAAPGEFAEKMGYLLTHSVGCTATFTQHAGVEALQGPQEQVESQLETLAEKRGLLLEGLNEIDGVSCPSPRGAFYVFPNVEGFQKDAEELADYLLKEAGVAVLPGTAFGAGGEGYLRLCYSAPRSELEEALKRIESALSELKT
ncbi:MAG: pyridoxal phosphate-dependent aminotransferase [Candidatus Acetothermia bacterium]